jgi:hypothetical protein
MRTGITSGIAILVLFSSRPLLAELAFQSSTDVKPLLTFAVAVAVVSIVVAVLYKLLARRPRTGARQKQERRVDLREQAAARGFRESETRLLMQVANRSSSSRREDLLDTETGRAYLMKDLERRLRRRQREIEAIRRIQGKLEKMGTREGLRPRETMRVETDMRIWATKKLQHSASPQQEEDEDVFVNIEPVAGRLRDISEGGAAIHIELDAERGDLVEFWSADAEIVLSPITAAVVDVSRESGQSQTTLHLYFMDPPMNELRAAIFALQSRNEARHLAT